MDNKKNDGFWDSIKSELENGVKSARKEKRNVTGIRIIYHLFAAPAVIFAKSLFLSSNTLRGRARLRVAAHKSIFHFAVNARLYELERGDRSELDKIKNEW